jgi:hypothetical protein
VYTRNKHREIFPFFSVALQPQSGPRHLIFELYRIHTMRHTHTHTHTHSRTPRRRGYYLYSTKQVQEANIEPATYQSSGRRHTTRTTRQPGSKTFTLGETGATCESCIEILYNLCLVTQDQQSDKKRIKHTASLNEKRSSERSLVTNYLFFWLFLYRLDEILYMDFWNTVKEL